MTTLADLKKKSQANLDRVVKGMNESNNFQKQDNPNIWSLKRGKDGNAFAIVRFLPISKVDDDKNREDAMPWVKVWSHSFQDPNTQRWYIEKSLFSIGKPDPIYELNRKLYDLKTEAAKKDATRQKRKLHYYSNVYIVADPANPENEGKIKIFEYGQKIHDKVKMVLDPPAEFRQKRADPFDFFKGKDFRLKVRTVDDWPNYEMSDFGEEKRISDKDDNELSDEQIVEIYENSHSLLDLIDPSQFKTYDVLKKRLDYVLGKSDEASSSTEETAAPKKSEKAAAPKSAPEPKKAAVVEESSSEETSDIDIDALLEGLDD